MDMMIQLKDLTSEEFAKALTLIDELGDKVESWEGGTPKKKPMRPRSVEQENRLAVSLYADGKEYTVPRQVYGEEAKAFDEVQKISGVITHTNVDPDAKNPVDPEPYESWINKKY